MGFLPQIAEMTYNLTAKTAISDTVTPSFDFKTGEFVFNSGKSVLVKGKDRLRLYVHKLLLTEIEKYAIYDGTAYGMEFYQWFFGIRDREFIKAQLSREIREKLLDNEEISEINNISFEFVRHECKMSFSVKTIYSENITDEVVLYG